jgi:hypothetical protein
MFAYSVCQSHLIQHSEGNAPIFNSPFSPQHVCNPFLSGKTLHHVICNVQLITMLLARI